MYVREIIVVRNFTHTQTKHCFKRGVPVWVLTIELGTGLYAEIFPRGGVANLGYGGGGEAYVRCYTLYLLGGGGHF